MSIFPHTLAKPRFHDSKLDPVRVKMINLILTDHYFSRTTLSKIGVEPSVECDVCGLSEKADYIIFACDKHYAARRYALRKFILFVNS